MKWVAGVPDALKPLKNGKTTSQIARSKHTQWPHSSSDLLPVWLQKQKRLQNGRNVIFFSKNHSVHITHPKQCLWTGLHSQNVKKCRCGGGGAQL